MSEIIVVDNGSNDRTCLIVMEAMRNQTTVPVRLVHEYRKGVVHARARGARFARYDLLACVDADNVLPEGWLARALFAMTPDVVAASGPIVYSDLPRWVQLASRAFYRVAALSHRLLGPMVQGGNYIVRRQALELAGGYDLRYEFFGEDTSTARRIARVGRVAWVRGMWAHSSGRRLAGQGVARTTARYVASYLWATLLDRPLTREYEDVRA